ncbi:hypothetical protein [Altererythrobacter lutimaris]|uniref:Uncharacterized protein n=1 Tax=Altererythrobacter lutimaris TaxID=2743979 RepID=A0A850H7B4_9SPHN|nr:hypothetical protein [Altererythrobacter lutimaris]NVE93743.1 hypothetical protein [Altererythrobacter lutimaris]
MTKGKSHYVPLLGSMALLAGCGEAPSSETAGPPSNLDINSAKRQCATVASINLMGSGVPDEAIEAVCSCSIDKLVRDGKFSDQRQPTEAEAEEAMNTCIDEVAAQMSSD